MYRLPALLLEDFYEVVQLIKFEDIFVITVFTADSEAAQDGLFGGFVSRR